MKLRQLQCLCAIVDAGFNLTGAARALHATQPAIGKQLRQFEEELGVVLIERAGSRLVGLTAAGHEALGWARIALQSAENIRSLAREVRDERDQRQATIRLATTHTHARYVLPPAISRFKAGQPDTAVSVLQGTPEGVVAMILAGDADIGVSIRPAHVPPELVALPVISVGQVVIAPPGHPVLRRRPLTLAVLADYPIVATAPDRPFRAEIDKTFRAAGLTVDFPVEASDSDVIKTYVEIGFGIGIIPGFAYDRKKDSALVARELGDLLPIGVSVALLRRTTRQKRHAFAFLEALAPALTAARVRSALLEPPEVPAAGNGGSTGADALATARARAGPL